MISGTLFHPKIAILLGLVTLSLTGYAQQSTIDVPDSLINSDSTLGIPILIVPFNPAMYFSDADKDIGEVSQVDPGQVGNKLNSSLEATVNEHLGLYYATQRLSTQKDAVNDLDIIFGSITYSPKVAVRNNEEEKGQIKNNGLKNLRMKVQAKEVAPEEQQDPLTYMDIVFDDGRLLEYLTKKYKVDYIIFFNQFEIKTDYANCIDLQLRNYAREIKLHYTVFNKEGKKISGEVITIPYNSNENDIKVFVEENFGEISHALLQRIYLRK